MSAQESFYATLAEHLARISGTAESVARMLKQLQEDEISMTDFRESLPTLIHDVERLHKVARAVNERMVHRPALKVWRGKPLTEQEYYFMRAAGVLMNSAHQLGLSPVDEYELHRHFCYEDDQKFCYVHPGPKPKKSRGRRIQLKVGCVPEQLSAQHLRPEQKAFFEEYLPELLARFQNNLAELHA